MTGTGILLACVAAMYLGFETEEFSWPRTLASGLAVLLLFFAGVLVEKGRGK